MEDIEKSGGQSIATPARITIVEDERNQSETVYRRVDGTGGGRHSRGSFSRHYEDEITSIQNRSTVPIEYRTL